MALILLYIFWFRTKIVNYFFFFLIIGTMLG